MRMTTKAVPPQAPTITSTHDMSNAPLSDAPSITRVLLAETEHDTVW